MHTVKGNTWTGAGSEGYRDVHAYDDGVDGDKSFYYEAAVRGYGPETSAKST